MDKKSIIILKAWKKAYLIGKRMIRAGCTPAISNPSNGNAFIIYAKDGYSKGFKTHQFIYYSEEA